MLLRPYQADTDGQVRALELMFGNPRICIHGPTGSGKGVQLANFLLDGQPQLALTHRRVLLDQISRVLTSYGIPHGFIASGYPLNPSAPIQLGMVQTLWSRSFRNNVVEHMKVCRRIHLDEVHQMRAAVANEIAMTYNRRGATIIGYTATPAMLDHLVDHVIKVVSVKELIEQGYLVPPKVFAPDTPDMQKFANLRRMANGEFSSLGLGNALNVKSMFGRALEHWRVLNAEEKPTLLFAPGVPQSLWFAEQFQANGVPAAHIDGDNVWVDGHVYDSDTKAREDIFKRLEAGDLKVVCNRYVLREGVDLPFVSHIITATAFGIRPSWVQSCGRGLRPSPGKTHCTIQDHGGNYLLHPALDSDEPWDIKTPSRVLANLRISDMRAPEPKVPEPIVCPKCHAVRVAGNECTNCGFKHQQSARWVFQVSGKLKLQEGRAFIPEKEKAIRTDASIWRNHYWAARKHRPNRTFKQVYGFVCKLLYRRISKQLPLMPIREEDWDCRVGDLKFDSLISEGYVPMSNGQNNGYDNTNTGVLFPNNRKENDRQPDVNGTIDIEGVEYFVSGWKGVSANSGTPYIKLRARNKQQVLAQQNQQQGGYAPAPQPQFQPQYAQQPGSAPPAQPPQQAYPQQPQYAAPPQYAPAPQPQYQPPTQPAPAGAIPGFGI